MVATFYFFFALSQVCAARRSGSILSPWHTTKVPAMNSVQSSIPPPLQASSFTTSILTFSIPSQPQASYSDPPTHTSFVGACASVSALVASFSSVSPAAATATIPAQVAYDCLHEVPFNQSAAVALLDSIRPYLNWQTTISYLKSPPSEYAEKVQPPYDFFAVWDELYSNASSGTYSSEYAFGLSLYSLFQRCHDGHFHFVPDSVGSIFTFGRTTPLVSVSLDGKAVPKIFAYADILATSRDHATFTPSHITEIDGQNAVDYLLDWSQCGFSQDRDALWNDLFYSPVRGALGSLGSGNGTFVGDSSGKFVFPGETTTLTFANGSSVTQENFARVLVNFTDISSGVDIYQAHFNTYPHATDNAFDLLDRGKPIGSRDPVASPRTSPLVNPSSIARHRHNGNSGYFIEGAGYEEVAVLSLPSFDGIDFDDYSVFHSAFIASAVAANKTKLIIDVSGNSGGQIAQGYDLFRQLFPSRRPYGATRFRAHDAFDLLGQESSYLSGLGNSLYRNPTDKVIANSVLNYRSDADIHYLPFTSWSEKYGPHEHGPADDKFTSIIRWNVSDMFPLVSLDFYDVERQPFFRKDILIISDVHCASTCAIFLELMTQQAGVGTVSMGGRPNKNITQAVGGVKGAEVYRFSDIFGLIEKVYTSSLPHPDKPGNESFDDYLPFADYNQLPLARSAQPPAVNVRDGIRAGDTTGLPLQFVYEPADCRIFYTSDMIVDQAVVWKTVVDAIFNEEEECVAGD